jgi:CBS domain-containing protein
MTTAREIMHTGAQCVGEDESLLTAAQMMRDLEVGSLPICGNDNRLRGIITDRDIVIRCLAEGRDPASVRAGEFAQGRLRWVDASADADVVVHTMEEYRIRRVPVLEDNQLVGIISEADLAQHLPEDKLAHFVESVYAPERSAGGR